MRVHFDSSSFSFDVQYTTDPSKVGSKCDIRTDPDGHGPAVFARRLMHALNDLGHTLVNDGVNADVSLVFIEPSGRPLAKKVIQRLDGIWFKPQDFATKNINIKHLYDRVDAVVFQSRFDQQMVSKWWNSPGLHNQPGRGTVICNGIRQKPITKFTSPELEHVRNTYDYVFVSSANWHPQKRLKANTDLFLHLRNNVLKSRCAYIVMGANPDHVIADPHVFYTGVVPEDVYMQVYSMANWMIHLAWLDHCPNTVIECMSQLTPVICSNDGGTKELGFCLALDEQVPYNFTLEDYDNPPSIDVTQVKELPDKWRRLPPAADITIETCAKKYVDLFTSLV